MAAVGVEEERAVEAAKAHIRNRGARIRERESERAIRRLQAHTDLSEQDEQAVRELAASLTDQLLSVPEDHLDAAASEDVDAARAAVTLALFGEE